MLNIVDDFSRLLHRPIEDSDAQEEITWPLLRHNWSSHYMLPGDGRHRLPIFLETFSFLVYTKLASSTNEQSRVIIYFKSVYVYS